MALTSGQIDEPIRQIAVRLGINENAPNVRQLVLDYDVEDVPTTQGLFTAVYGTVSGWISQTDANGNDTPIEGVDKSAWTFLRAAG